MENKMNQVTISPNNKDTLLLVAVPNGSHSFWESIYTWGAFEYMTSTNDLKHFSISTDITINRSKIIGLASSITEEQAKKLVDENPYWDNAKQSIESLIRTSGLTLGKDQDCLILKIN